MKNTKVWIENLLVFIVAFLLLQSLYFKFSDAPETQYIFSTLDDWAASFLVPGLFKPGGIFSAKIVGSFELLAASILLISLFKSNRLIRLAGAILTAQVIAGAIFFHIFTPLGLVVLDDSGLLFGMACLVFTLSLTIIWLNKESLLIITRFIQRAGRK